MRGVERGRRVCGRDPDDRHPGTDTRCHPGWGILDHHTLSRRYSEHPGSKQVSLR